MIGRRARPTTGTRTALPQADASASATAVVDTALSMAARREILTTEEAMSLLQGVQIKIDQRDAAEAIAAIITDASEADRDSVLVDRTRVVDRLLDMRLALTR